MQKLFVLILALLLLPLTALARGDSNKPIVGFMVGPSTTLLQLSNNSVGGYKLGQTGYFTGLEFRFFPKSQVNFDIDLMYAYRQATFTGTVTTLYSFSAPVPYTETQKYHELVVPFMIDMHLSKHFIFVLGGWVSHPMGYSFSGTDSDVQSLTNDQPTASIDYGSLFGLNYRITGKSRHTYEFGVRYYYGLDRQLAYSPLNNALENTRYLDFLLSYFF